MLSSQTSTATLVRESGDPGDSSDAEYVVHLPDLEPCRMCGTQVTVLPWVPTALSLLLGWDPKGEKLACMFSTWLVSGTLSRVFKKCRTVLIPKTTDPGRLGDVNQWRPITIGSMVLRLW